MNFIVRDANCESDIKMRNFISQQNSLKLEFKHLAMKIDSFIGGVKKSFEEFISKA